MSKPQISYTCAGCGAQAVSSPGPGGVPGVKGSRVLVPHLRGCPVAARVAEMRTRALVERRA